MQRQVWKENIKVGKKDKEEESYVMGSNPFDAEEMLLIQERIFVEEQDKKRRKAETEGR